VKESWWLSASAAGIKSPAKRRITRRCDLCMISIQSLLNFHRRGIISTDLFPADPTEHKPHPEYPVRYTCLLVYRGKSHTGEMPLHTNLFSNNSPKSRINTSISEKKI
jgi:hypothetical protein